MTLPLLQQSKNVDTNDPNDYTSPIPTVIEFPIGLATPGSSEAGPFFDLSCFKYKRSFRQSVSGQSDKLYVIRLPFPLGGVNFGSSANYVDFNALLGASDGSKSMGNIAEQIKQGLASQAAGALATGTAELMSMLASSIPGVSISEDQIKNQVSSVLSMTFNPRLEKAFNGMNMRSYNFEYTLIPKNAAESAAIQEIISHLEDSMYPEPLDDLRVFLDYPDEFTGGFFNIDGTRISSVPLIPDCFISSFNAVYNPNTGSRIFPDGSPTSYRISFQLVEANNLTRKDIQILRNGYRTGLGL